MAVTLIVETGAGLTTANTYITLAAAETYFETRLHKAAWTAATDPDKNIALVWATRMLDDHFDWAGVKKDEDQALRWPRSGVFDEDGYWVDDSTLPTPIANATAELALYLLDKDRTGEPDGVGVNRVRAGEVEVEFDKADRDAYAAPIPESVVKLIGVLGMRRSRRPSTVPVLRT